MKDYYKILGVPPSAGQQDVKKAYRALAFKYHPDKNPDSSLAEAQFKEIQEAYATLSVSRKKEQYDDERWMAGMGAKIQYTEAVSPSWLLGICTQLNADLAVMDTYRMSHGALQMYILLILTDAHLGILQHHADKELNKAIITELLKATEKLDVQYLDEITQRLVLLATGDQELISAIYGHDKTRRKTIFREEMLPYVVLMVTIALCVFMYLYAGWR